MKLSDIYNSICIDFSVENKNCILLKLYFTRYRGFIFAGHLSSFYYQKQIKLYLIITGVRSPNHVPLRTVYIILRARYWMMINHSTLDCHVTF